MNGSISTAPRIRTEDDLLPPSNYALAAWGISETIRLRREQFGLRIADIARLTNIDSAQLSRLEAGNQNISLDGLIDIARVLRISIEELLSPPTWYQQRAVLPKGEGGPVSSLACCPSTTSHFLHPTHIRLRKGDRLPLPLADEGGKEEMASWIVLRGRILLGIEEEDAERLLPEQSVSHFRYGPKAVEALEDSDIIQLVCASKCYNLDY